MSDQVMSNYPDLLGHITSGERAAIGAAQVALALRPRVNRAGRPLSVLILVQNTTDSELEVAVRLRLPERDANKAKGRFISKHEKLVVDVRPAEVGRISLPVSTLPDTTPSSDYKISVETKVRPKQRKPNRIRQAEGGGHVNLSFLDEERQEQIEDLGDLTWFTDANRGGVIQANLTIMGGKVGKFADLEPSYVTLWSLVDHADDRAMLLRNLDVVRDQVLPRITRRKTYEILYAETKKHFSKSSYSVQALEMNLIARLLTFVVELAAAEERDVRLIVGRELNVRRLLDKGKLQNQQEAIDLPAWFGSLLRIISRDERMVQFPLRAVAHFAYMDLMRDAILHAYDRIEGVTGKPLVKPEQRGTKADNLITAIKAGQLDFEKLYAPLVIGGILVADKVLLENEKPYKLPTPLRAMMDAHHDERNEANEPLFALAHQLIEQLFNQYGATHP